MISQYDIGTVVMLNNLKEGKEVDFTSALSQNIRTLTQEKLEMAK